MLLVGRGKGQGVLGFGCCLIRRLMILCSTGLSRKAWSHKFVQLIYRPVHPSWCIYCSTVLMCLTYAALAHASPFQFNNR